MKAVKRLEQKLRPSPSPSPSPYEDHVSERPDSGSKSCIGSGPSSGHRRDNPHLQTKRSRHAS